MRTLLSELLVPGLRLTPVDGHLEVGSEYKLSDKQVDFIRRHKGQLIRELRQTNGNPIVRYKIRKRDIGNRAGWFIRETPLSIEQMQADWGEDYEVKVSPSQTMIGDIK